VLEEELLFPATRRCVFRVDGRRQLLRPRFGHSQDDNREVSITSTRHASCGTRQGRRTALYVGNLKAGSHELVALFGGKGPNERDYRGASIKFEKGVGGSTWN